MAKVLKSGPRTPRTPIDEAPPVAPKQTVLQARSSAGQFQTQKSNHESPQLMNSDSSHDYLQAKPSASLIPSSRDEAREANNTSESLLSPPTRPIKTALGTRVLPALDANGDAPPVRLRHFQIEKKGAQIEGRVRLTAFRLQIVSWEPRSRPHPVMRRRTAKNTNVSSTFRLPLTARLSRVQKCPSKNALVC